MSDFWTIVVNLFGGVFTPLFDWYTGGAVYSTTQYLDNTISPTVTGIMGFFVSIVPLFVGLLALLPLVILFRILTATESSIDTMSPDPLIQLANYVIDIGMTALSIVIAGLDLLIPT